MTSYYQKAKAWLNKPKISQSEHDSAINILLLGETGVGKSTFINSFANYLLHPNFDDARRSEFTYLIPSKFMVATDDGHEVLINQGDDNNEDRNMGNSSTQAAKAYTFRMQDNRLVRIIDTPGIGDARGTMQDRENFENILIFLGRFSHLHGICFLMKPNVTVINTFFKFCLLELMTRLDKSASKNIIYIFTNTRATNYHAPDTIANIRRVTNEVEKKQQVKIPLSNANIFCFDNEGFKHLVAKQQGVNFGNPDTMRESWNISCNSSWKLLAYVMGDGKTNSLQPHRVQDTVSINEARRLITQLAKPLADITDLINDNLHMLSQHEKRLNQENISKEDLEKVLYVPVVKIRQKELSQPATVCSASGCTEEYAVAGVTKRHYKQRCHDPCYLVNVPKEIIGSPELLHCYAMSGDTCRECGCQFSTHMHIYYESETYDTKMEDDSVKSQLKNKTEIMAAQQNMIQKLKKEKAAYDSEHKIISQSMAKFAHFLREHSLCTVNDAYDEYLEILIKRENTPMGDKVLLERYRSLKNEHIELQRVLAESGRNDGAKRITSEDIFQTIQDLYNLKITGAIIQNIQKGMNKTIKNEHHLNNDDVITLTQSASNYSSSSNNPQWNSNSMQETSSQSVQSPQSNDKNDLAKQLITKLLSEGDIKKAQQVMNLLMQSDDLNQTTKQDSTYSDEAVVQIPSRKSNYHLNKNEYQGRYRDNFGKGGRRERSDYVEERPSRRRQLDDYDEDWSGSYDDGMEDMYKGRGRYNDAMYESRDRRRQEDRAPRRVYYSDDEEYERRSVADKPRRRQPVDTDEYSNEEEQYEKERQMNYARSKRDRDNYNVRERNYPERRRHLSEESLSDDDHSKRSYVRGNSPHGRRGRRVPERRRYSSDEYVSDEELERRTRRKQHDERSDRKQSARASRARSHDKGSKSPVRESVKGKDNKKNEKVETTSAGRKPLPKVKSEDKKDIQKSNKDKADSVADKVKEMKIEDKDRSAEEANDDNSDAKSGSDGYTVITKKNLKGGKKQ